MKGKKRKNPSRTKVICVSGIVFPETLPSWDDLPFMGSPPQGRKNWSVLNRIVVQESAFSEVCQTSESARRADEASMKGKKKLFRTKVMCVSFFLFFFLFFLFVFFFFCFFLK
jgi:hypothetical protein